MNLLPYNNDKLNILGYDFKGVSGTMSPGMASSDGPQNSDRLPKAIVDIMGLLPPPGSFIRGVSRFVKVEELFLQILNNQIPEQSDDVKKQPGTEGAKRKRII